MPDFTFYLETYGCKVNQYESQVLRQAWQEAGGMEISVPEQADYILINSCAITARAERNARNALCRLRKTAPNAKIILTGCAAQFYADFVPRKHARLVLPDICVNQEDKKLLLAGPKNAASTILPASADIEPLRILTDYGRSRPVVKVQDGCSQNCAYCIVPQTRGKPRGRDARNILAECRSLARQGFGELVLSGINLRQRPDGFWPLLAFLDKELAPEFAGKTRLRISSIDPAMLNDDGLSALESCKLICPQLHISLQHASPHVLAMMGRTHYNRQMIRKALGRIGQIWPIFGLGADILVGFPGETEADLQILLDFAEEIPLTYAHVFPFSRRQGTKAKNMPDQIAKKEKEERAARVREVIATKQQEFLQRQLQLDQVRVVPELGKNGRRKGVNEFYSACVFEEEPRKGINTAKPVAVKGNELIVLAGTSFCSAARHI